VPAQCLGRVRPEPLEASPSYGGTACRTCWAGETREGRRALLEDERRFIDLANPRLIYAAERNIPLAGR